MMDLANIRPVLQLIPESIDFFCRGETQTIWRLEYKNTEKFQPKF